MMLFRNWHKGAPSLDLMSKVRVALRVVVTITACPRYVSREAAWGIVGPVLARILAERLKYEMVEHPPRATLRKRDAG